MEAKAVRSERLNEKEMKAGYLVGVCITDISESNRARYLEYLTGLNPDTGT